MAQKKFSSEFKAKVAIEALKGNQGNLHVEVKDFFETACLKDAKGIYVPCASLRPILFINSSTTM